MKNRTLFLVLLVVFSAILIAGCTTSTTPPPATTPTPAPTAVTTPANSAGCTQHLQDGSQAVMTNQSNIRNLRYCEISLICGTGPGTASMYNTAEYNKQPAVGGGPKDTCPDSLWNNISESAMATQFNVPSVWKNGPRFWTADAISIPQGTKLNFNGLDANWFAYPSYPPNVQSLGITSGSYIVTKVQRNSKIYFDEGKPLFILSDPNGTPYVMQAGCKIVNPNLTYEDLFTLNTQLKNPPGWTYKVVTINKPLTIQAINGVATITQDSLGNSYDACYSENGQSTCSFIPQ
jgi:hypothetical protein